MKVMKRYFKVFKIYTKFSSIVKDSKSLTRLKSKPEYWVFQVLMQNNNHWLVTELKLLGNAFMKLFKLIQHKLNAFQIDINFTNIKFLRNLDNWIPRPKSLTL